MMNKAILICVGVTALIVVIAFTFMWNSVEPTQYGMTYNILTKTAGMDKIYDGCLYFVDPFQHFVKFPATVLHVEFSDRLDRISFPLETRTKEGLQLILHVSCQHKLYKEDILKLCKLANVVYKETFISQAKNVILEEVSTYNAPEYWEKRSEIVLKLVRDLILT